VMEPIGRKEDGKFWMVWSPQGRAPTKAHRSYDDAAKEASRLARSQADSIFVVLEALAAFRTEKPQPPPIECVPLAEVTDEIPF